MKILNIKIIVDDEAAYDVVESLDEVLNQFIDEMNDNDIKLFVETSEPEDISIKEVKEIVNG